MDRVEHRQPIKNSQLKRKHWRAFPTVFAPNAAPVFEFSFELRHAHYNRSNGLITPPPPTFRTCV